MINVFSGDAFSVVEMTTQINKIKFIPTRIEQMGLFVEKGVRTTVVGIEEQNGTLSLVPTKDRRAETNLNIADRRKIRDFRVPHIPLDDAILPDDVQNVRVFGSEDTLAGPAQIVADRLRQMRNKLQATKEYHRIGALKGVVLDADATTVIYDLFDEFDITQEVVGFDLNNTSAEVMDGTTEVKDLIEDELGAATYDHVHAFCGRTFFSKLVKHASVRAAYQLWRDGEFLRTDNRYRGFEFAGVIWEQYRGKVGDISFVDDDEAHFFPVGVPDLFQLYHAPGNFMGATNTLGLPYYARQNPLPNDRGIGLFTETNPLAVCTRPGVLIKGVIGPNS